MKNDNLTFKPDAQNYKENSVCYLGYLEPDWINSLLFTNLKIQKLSLHHPKLPREWKHIAFCFYVIEQEP